METPHHISGWNLYLITFRPSHRGKAQTWERFAPNAETAEASAARIVQDEFDGRGKLLSVHPA